MKLYILNNCITFRRGTNQLVLNGKPDVTAKLTWPAARCLEIMLEQSGNVVSHAELYRKVWEDKGMNVPPNTLYQNISIIRRALKSVVPDGDKLIRTVPRKGFQIRHAVTADTVEVSNKVPVSPEENTADNAIQLPDDVSTEANVSLLSHFGKFIVLLFQPSEQWKALLRGE